MFSSFNLIHPERPSRGAHALNMLVTRHALGFAVLVTLTLAAVLGAYALLTPQPIERHPLFVLGFDAIRYLFATGLLIALGWWKKTGFTRLPTWPTIVVFLPLASLPLLLLFSARLGTTDLVLIGVIVETALAAGFTEEALFRGVVLRALEPRGLMQAAAISALLFGLLHAPGVLVGANPLIIGLQVVWAALFGFACATVVLVTDQIWPAVGIHFALNGISMLSSGKIVADERPDNQALIGLLLLIVFMAILAGYGYWLLRRHLPHQPQMTAGPAG